MFGQQKPARRQKSGYVSEFEQFMGHFLEDHPDVLDNQRRGWNIFWDRKVDLDELKKAEEDSVPMKDFLPQ
ncbi:MAG: DUF3460 family protein [Pseudomonadota bacterium]